VFLIHHREFLLLFFFFVVVVVVVVVVGVFGFLDCFGDSYSSAWVVWKE